MFLTGKVDSCSITYACTYTKISCVIHTYCHEGDGFLNRRNNALQTNTICSKKRVTKRGAVFASDHRAKSCLICSSCNVAFNNIGRQNSHSSFNNIVNLKGFKGNIEQRTLENDTFRKALYTAQQLQLVLMSLQVG